MSGINRKNTKEESRVENPIIVEEFKIGVCKGDPEDGLALSFSGKHPNSPESGEFVAIMPVSEIQEILGGLFELGVEYQKETGIDIGFSSVIKGEE